MNQSLSQSKETSNSDKEKYYQSILESVNKGQTTISSGSTQDFIKKHNITSKSDPKKIVEILAHESINEILLEFKKNGKIEELNGTYFYDGKKFTPKQIQETIARNFKNEIQQMINKRFENIKLELKKQSNNMKIQSNIQEKISIANNIISLKSDLKKQEEAIEKKTEQYLSSLYKLNKAQAEQRKENVQIRFNESQQLFQQDILSAKDKTLSQGYEGLQIQLNQQKIQIDQAKQQQDQHIQNLESKFLSELNKQAQFEQRQKQQQEQHEQMVQLQNDIANRADQNVRNLIDSAKSNNDALIDANQKNTQALMDANAKLAQAQMDANARNTQSMIDNQIKGNNAIVQGLNQIGANINALQSDFANLNQQFNALNNNMQIIGSKINNPPPLPPAPPGMPPGCAGAKKPWDCEADPNNPWNLTPIYRNATNIRTRQTGIEIYQCNRTGHFCSSDGNQGKWGELSTYYNNLY